LRVRELMKFRDEGQYDKILRREMQLPAPPSTPAPQQEAAPGAVPNALSSVSSALSGVKFGNPFKKG